MNNPFTKPAEDFSDQVGKYVDLKLDEIKLKTAKGLSITLQKVLVAILLLSLVNIVLIAAAIGGVLILGHIIDNYAAGAFIIAGVFAIITLVLYMLRKKLFINSFVKTFINIFFEDKAEDEIL